ncbi:MAG: hypothetical protein GY855_14480, partial [candidate division Zixibacteria bacterium]|nr:hypothetical protein [candidate division Zixibacteria bacterium]
MGKALYSNFSAVQEYDWSINWKNVVFSTLLVLVNFVYFSWILKIFVKYFSGKNIPLATVYRIFAIAGLGKYIPGKIWALTGMVVLFQREGVDRADGIIATITYQYIYIAAGLMLTVCGGMVYFREWLTPLLLVIGIPIMLLMIYPPILSSFMNFALRKFGINQECRRLKFRTGLYFMFLFLISWVVYGIAFYIFINGIIELPLSSLFILMVIFACAYVIGFV